MKKIQFSFLFIVLTCLITVISCTKNETTTSSVPLSNNESVDHYQNEATWVSLGKGISGLFGLRLRSSIGHLVSECGGTCIKLFGQYYHIDCRGYGNKCPLDGVVSVSIDSVQNNYQLITIDLDMFGETLDFHLPDRSLMITNPLNSTELYLNIPEQELHRTDTTEPFVISNAWFSELPEFENL